MYTELVAALALALGLYGAFIAAKWDRKISKFFGDGNLENKVQTVLEDTALQEKAVQIATASMVNTFRILLMTPDTQKLLDEAMKKHGPALAESAARGYILATKEGISPGQALARQRWPESRGSKQNMGQVMASEDPIGAAINQMLPKLLERALAGGLSGTGNTLSPGSSPGSTPSVGGEAFRPPV